MTQHTKCIFYFAYFGDEQECLSTVIDRYTYIASQLQYLSNLCDENNIQQRFLVATIPDKLHSALFYMAREYKFNICHQFTSNENSFEYPGIAACTSFAKQNPSAIIYYCHSKGSVNRTKLSMGIFKHHCSINLAYNLDEFISAHDKYKAGLFPSEYGWLWHNFFWVKASYLMNKEVQKSPRRHYYESFIGEQTYRNTLAHKNVMSTLPDSFFIEQSQLSKKDFYEATNINQCAFLNSEYRRLGEKT